jgi:hypothetical protein
MTNESGIKKLCTVIAAVSCLGALEIGFSDIVQADSVLLGSDYLATVPVTRFDFGGPIGVVDLQGRPFGAGNPAPAGYPASGLANTDTVVQRQANASLPVQNTASPSSATVPIQMVGLSLQNVIPVNVGGSFFDVFVHLTPGTSSLGTMTITHNFLDNGTPAPEGNFTSFFDVFFTADFTPRLGGSPFSISGDLPLTGNGSWSHEPPPGVVLVTGAPGNQMANLHTPLPAGFNDFFPTGIISESHPGQGLHSVVLASPEPSTLLLLASGLTGLGYQLRRGRKV